MFLDFSSAYMAAKDMRRRVAHDPGTLGADTVEAMAGALNDPAHEKQSNARFLYREIARGLAELAVKTKDRNVRAACLNELKDTACNGNNVALMAAGEALGCLPVNLPHPDVSGPERGGLPHATLDAIADLAGVTPLSKPNFLGRTLVCRIAEGGFLSIKLARRGPGPARSLHREAAWMEKLAENGCPEDFRLPRPVRFQGRYVFRLLRTDIPGAPRGLPRDALALAYVAPPGYYDYPNDVRPGRLPSAESFLKIMERGARLLGFLAGRGILHTAAVPLFHNRTQGPRRPDEGVYEWRRMGRLDRWLESSLYPNFGASGLRDFEHLEPLAHGENRRQVLRSAELAYRIGDHALALLLVAGGYFRARDPKRVGRDTNGQPVDARPLFDKSLLTETIEAVFGAYVRGFTGIAADPRPLHCEALAERMIEEMGVDKDMEEVVRARDQNDMTREQFRNLLVSGGYAPIRADKTTRGEADATILTGPHLGEFNGPTSLPELSLFAASMSGLAVAERFESLSA